MTTCPYCQQQALSQLRKACLGPALSVQCKACGKRISVPPTAMLAATPFIFGIFLADFLASYGWHFSALSLLAGFLAMAAIHAVLVPLVPRGA